MRFKTMQRVEFALEMFLGLISVAFAAYLVGWLVWVAWKVLVG